MGKIQLQNLQISLAGEQAVYKAGDNIIGTCSLSMNGELNMDQISIKLIGIASVLWTEKQFDKNYTYSNTHTCVELLYNPGVANQTVLTAGQHQIHFSFQIPDDIPNSFSAFYGRIKYRIEARIRKPEMLSRDHRCEVELTMRSPTKYSVEELLTPINVLNCKKFLGIFSSGSLELSARINQKGQTMGSSVEIYCSVENRSNKSLPLRATLKSVTTFYAKNKSKTFTDKLSRVEGQLIAPFSSSNQVLSMSIPESLQSWTNCPIIQMKHVIIVTLDISGSRDLHCELPVLLHENNATFDF